MSSDIPVYKIYLLDSAGKESRLFVFQGERQTPFDEFSDIDKQILRENNIIPQYSSQQIHSDDSIRAIKKKIIYEYGQNLVSYDELYMFTIVKKTFHLFKAYIDITNNETLPLTLPMIYQLLVNINIPAEKMSEIQEKLDQKNTGSYSYDDLLQLGIHNETFEIALPLGLKFGKSHSFLFSTNPFSLLQQEKTRGAAVFQPTHKNP